MPDWLINIHRRLPTQPPSLMFCLFLNRVLPQYGSPLVLEEGQCIDLEVLDLGFRVHVLYEKGRFVPASSGQLVNVRIAANYSDLLSLARREEDADTLFFNRRLILDGDTELGLRIKNWADSLDWPAWMVGRMA